jgi:predicted nucleic acid-binding protein
VPPTTGLAHISLPDLDVGEREAILLALHLKADFVLMDERDGVEEARRLGLSVTGTLGILEQRLIELGLAIAELRRTNFVVTHAYIVKGPVTE